MNPPGPEPLFDGYADDYDAALGRGISVSGESKEYFARERVAWLARRLRALGARPGSALDYGCGTGSAAPHLLALAGVGSVTGLDPSPRILERARAEHPDPRIRFVLQTDHRPADDHDLAFCNGVFHHIPPDRRAEAAEIVLRSLRPGGWFALWENNPWNPGTRLVMRRIPFDRDAIPLSAPESVRLLRAAGFAVRAVDFLFIFPRALRIFRFLEPWLARLPLGAQYQVLARRPDPAPVSAGPAAPRPLA